MQENLLQYTGVNRFNINLYERGRTAILLQYLNLNMFCKVKKKSKQEQYLL